MEDTPLDDVRVLDLSTGIAGPYCTKVLADAGADVVKVEPPDGDPLRRYGSGALFAFLNTSKRSVTGDPTPWVAAADVIVANGAPPDGSQPGCIQVAITPFGLTGPWAGRAATEFTLQGWCGSTANRGTPDRAPIAAGGQIGEFEGGTYAAVAVLAALRGAPGTAIDLSLLETMSVTMNTYTSVFATFLGWDPTRVHGRSTGAGRTIEMPSIEPTADGWVGFTTITAQQFADFLVLIGRPDLIDDRELASVDGRNRRRAEFLEMVHDWTRKRTTAEIIEEASLLRIPVGPVGNGATVSTFDQFVSEGTFVENPGGGFTQPRVPYRIHGLELRPFTAAPALGEHRVDPPWAPRPLDGTARPLPLDGLRVIDFTAFWAGPAATCMLAGRVGADVIKVESIQRPDGMRFATTRPPSVEQWWEWGPLYNAVNANKRGITLDMNSAEGRDVTLRLIATADAVVENFTPRVMDNFGITWEAIHAANPRACFVRMPGFGLSGPWRERAGFAQTMEQVSGMAWITGFADGPPVIPRGACDPLAGMHAVIALLVAWRDRERSGEGRLVEVAMVEAALNAAAEPVVEHAATGRLIERDGNRGIGAPQGLYPCAGEENWLALAVTTDPEWVGLRHAMDDPAWASAAELDTEPGRHAAHDAIDAEITAWCASRELDDVVDRLLAHGVPAAPALLPRDILLNPQMQARGFFEEVSHPVTGVHPIPTVPFRMSGHDGRWLRTPAPTIGQYNDEVLSEVAGLSAEEIAGLRQRAVIGDRPVGL